MAYNLEQIAAEESADVYADPREEEGSPRSGRILRIGVALVVMGVFAGGLWFAYTQGVRHAGVSADNGEVPLIRADNRPFKVKPEKPGGMQLPDRDLLIYGQQQRPQIEHLLPPPEQPMARPVPPPQLPTPWPPPIQTAAVAPSPPALPNAAAVLMQTATTPQTTTALPAAAPLGPAPAKGSRAGAAAAPSTDPIGDEIGRLAAAAANKPQLNLAHMVSGRVGGLRLQLGATRTETEARGQWERLKRTNPDLLGKLSAVAIRADLADKGVYYRLQAGPIADPSTADRVCGELRQRHLACMIVR